MSTRALLSQGDGSDEPIDLAAAGRRRIRDDELLWVDLEAPAAGELTMVREALGIGDTTLTRLDTVPHGPDAAIHDDAVEVVVTALGEDIEDDPVPLQVLIGEGWVVTNHGAPVRFLADHWEMIQDQREVGRLSSLEFLIALLDWHLAIFDATEALESEVDKLDEAALRSESDLLERLVRMRKRLARFRRTLYPHREVLAELARPDFLPNGGDGTDSIQGLLGRFDRAQDAVTNVREMLIGTFDVHMTRVAQRTNDVMRILTLASVVLLPSVVVAGVIGDELPRRLLRAGEPVLGRGRRDGADGARDDGCRPLAWVAVRATIENPRQHARGADSPHGHERPQADQHQRDARPAQAAQASHAQGRRNPAREADLYLRGG